MLVVLALLSAACWNRFRTSHSRAGRTFSEGGTDACPPPERERVLGQGYMIQ